MSQYPNMAGGGWPPPTQPNRQAQQGFGHPPYGGYVAPYGNPFVQQSQASFTQNATQIPGLSGSPIPPTAPASHGSPSWATPTQGPTMPLNAFPYSNQQQSHGAYAQQSSSVPPRPASLPLHAPVMPAKLQQQTEAEELEEGELESDDLYE